ncbi:MAG TPA: hypothetical protein VHV50_09290 [Actinomycetota bacterium]|jgi:hypothetical protein|nr:hypothetical protein [Actinomycetota bacterium]
MEIVIIPTLVVAADTRFQVLSDVVATWPRTPPAVDVQLRSRSVAPPD